VVWSELMGHLLLAALLFVGLILGLFELGTYIVKRKSEKKEK